MPNASTGVLDVARSPRNQVNVTVEDGLAGGTADVQSDVETLDGGICTLQDVSRLVQECVAGEEFRLRQREVVRCVPSRNHERVHRGDGEPVPKDVSEIVRQELPLLRGITEDAVGHASGPSGVWTDDTP